MIFDGRQSARLQVDDLLKGFPLEWPGQDARFELATLGIVPAKGLQEVMLNAAIEEFSHDAYTFHHQVDR